MRIAFMGTPDFSVPTLDALAAEHDVAAVYTQPPRPAGRGKAPTPSPVHKRAEALGLVVRHPVTLRDADEQAAFAALDLDVAVVAAYGLILPVPILAAPRRGCLNVHASLLPRWRGAAPVQRAILAGDAETGVCIMQMEKGLDTGPVRHREPTDIKPYETAGILTDRLSQSGAKLMAQVLKNFDAYPPVPQTEAGITYAAKIDKAEARIDWSAGAEQVDRQIRAFNPAPGAWFEFSGERIKVLTADIPTDVHLDRNFRSEPGLVLDSQLAIGCGIGAIRPLRVQRAGRGVVDFDELLRGFPIPKGTKVA
jgi:methionyl-tRNA formyltransferase